MSNRRLLRRAARRVVLPGFIALMTWLVVPIHAEAALPVQLHLPFSCGVRVADSTYAGHQPSELAVDFNVPAAELAPYYGNGDRGTPILAPAAGRVVNSVPSNGQITLDVGNGVLVTLAHMSDQVADNTQVTAGQRIGLMSDIGKALGYADGVHLHLHVTVNGAYVRPEFYEGVVDNDPSTRLTSSLGCANPFGNFEELLLVTGGLWPKGVGIDPDLGTNAADVLFYLDGVPHPRKADKARPDVGAAWPAYGSNHGFGDLLLTGSGFHTVCVVVINAGPGNGNTSLGCKSAFVPVAVGEGAKPWPGMANGLWGFRASYDAYGGSAVIGVPENAVHGDPRGLAQLQDTRGGTHRRGLLVQRGVNPVFIVSGDHRDYLEVTYGGSVFDWMGYPTNNNHRWGTGGTQDFDGGRFGPVLLMKGDHVGRVYKVFGGIRYEYVKNGGAPSRLGYPVSDEYPWNGEIHQGFEGGWVCWRYDNTSYVVWKR